MRTIWRRLGPSLGVAALWTWGLLLVRMLRDGWQPLEVWFSYSLSFGMTAVYAYIGLLIWETFSWEGGGSAPKAWSGRLRRLAGPLTWLGLAGALVAVVAVVGWLLLRDPGEEALPGTISSVVLVLMILGVTALCTFIARGARVRD